MKLKEMIGQALELQGFNTFTEAAKKTGVSHECLRVFLNCNHIPKDRTLLKIAKSLGLDHAAVMLAAQKERLPKSLIDNLLMQSTSRYEKKRVWPLSQEQCDYLGEIMNTLEIQLLRKYRQVSVEGQTQIKGYIDYMFTLHRQERPAEENRPDSSSLEAKTGSSH